MIRQVTGVGATGLLLVAVLYHPGIAAVASDFSEKEQR